MHTETRHALHSNKHCSTHTHTNTYSLREFFLAHLGATVRGGVINIWPAKSFETVPVIQTNTVELNCREL